MPKKPKSAASSIFSGAAGWSLPDAAQLFGISATESGQGGCIRNFASGRMRRKRSGVQCGCFAGGRRGVRRDVRRIVRRSIWRNVRRNDRRRVRRRRVVRRRRRRVIRWRRGWNDLADWNGDWSFNESHQDHGRNRWMLLL